MENWLSFTSVPSKVVGGACVSVCACVKVARHAELISDETQRHRRDVIHFDTSQMFYSLPLLKIIIYPGLEISEISASIPTRWPWTQFSLWCWRLFDKLTEDTEQFTQRLVLWWKADQWNLIGSVDYPLVNENVLCILWMCKHVHYLQPKIP